VFTVTLSAASNRPVSAGFTTADGTATAGSDYTTTAGTLTLAPGQTATTITVPVLGDQLVESDETLSVVLSNLVNATAAGPGTGTIINDDTPPPPSATIDDVTAKEGDSGSSDATFTVRLSAPAAQAVTIDFATVDGSAAAGSDYTTTRGTVTLAPGQTAQSVTVPVLGDLAYEPTESFSVVLSNAVGATIADGQGDGTIFDNDPPPLAFSIDDAQIQEGNSGTRNLVFHVHLSGVGSAVEWAVVSTHDGTATAGGDYAGLTNYGLTFFQGVTEQTISIPIVGDLVAEPDETFSVTIDRASRSISDGLAIGTILNDDIG
jgi:hypothetical protein